MRLYLSAGAVEPSETSQQAAIRETEEEAGIPIVLDGILEIDYVPPPGGQARLRVIFPAHSADDTPPKAEPDEHSREAGWFLPSELRSLRLRRRGAAGAAGRRARRAGASDVAAGPETGRLT